MKKDVMRKRDRGQVVTFYSFKGGVGRSMALANVAALCAQRGKTVLALDFDFEAPGLHRYFLTTEESSFERYTPSKLQDGVIELFCALRERLQSNWPCGRGFQEPAAQEQLLAVLAELLDSQKYLYQVRLRNPNVKRGRPAEIQFMAAARFDDSYPERVRRFDWQAFYDAYAEVFPALAAELARRYDYVLIDSRTGVTDIGSICTMMLPDKLVLVFSPNEQSLQGVLEAGWQSVQERKASMDARPLPLFPLLSRVENSEESLKRYWVTRARGAFERMFREAYGLDVCDLETYFNLVRIPHQSFYAYGERIAAEEQPDIETGSLAQAFRQFTECLEHESAEDAQNMLDSMGEAEKEEVEEELLRKLKSEKDLRKMVQQRPDVPMLQLLYANFLVERKRFLEAITVYEQVADRFDNVSDTETQTAVAIALVSKGFALGELKRRDQELAAYEEAIHRFGDAAEPEQREQVAIALISKGYILGRSDRSEEELAAYDELLRRFGNAPELSLREQVAQALFNKGVALGTLNRVDEELATYNELLRRFKNAPELSLREQVAQTLLNKGVALSTLNRSDEELATYDELLRRFGDAPELPLREQVAQALLNKSITLGTLSKVEEELATYDELLRRFRDAPELPLRQQMAQALFNKGITLSASSRREEALATYDELLRRFGDTSEPSLRKRTAQALLNKAIILSDLSRDEETLTIYDEVVRRFGDAPEPTLRAHVARALFNKGVRLSASNRYEEALAAYDEVIRRFGDATEPALRAHVVRALFDKGARLSALKRHEKALAAYDEVIRRFGDAPEVALREPAARALLRKSAQLHALNRTDEALAVCGEIARRFGEAKETKLNTLVARALNFIGFTRLTQAKQHWNNDNQMARSLLQDAESTISSALARTPEAPVVLGNAGYAAFLLGREEDARALLAKAILLGGEELRQGELNDADIYPLPQDDAFRALIRSLPGPDAEASRTAPPSLDPPDPGAKRPS
ncbi:MAG TPA: tetratricopeptide repeat protein [Sorangium sp.]|nr:tetratricopeptide repeat protein [Sorangium sp.]